MVISDGNIRKLGEGDIGEPTLRSYPWFWIREEKGREKPQEMRKGGKLFAVYSPNT